MLIGQWNRAYKDILTILGRGVGISHESKWSRKLVEARGAQWNCGLEVHTECAKHLTHGKHLRASKLWRWVLLPSELVFLLLM